MPLTTTVLGTSITSTAPPRIDIKVSNGGPGPGDTAVVTVHVSWDPAIMSFDSVVGPTARVTVGSSWVTWTDYGIPYPGDKTFKLKLYRKSGVMTDTFVIATATDIHSGDFDSVKWPVPAGYVQEP